jgi:hypothetical protein
VPTHTGGATLCNTCGKRHAARLQRTAKLEAVHAQLVVQQLQAMLARQQP